MTSDGFIDQPRKPDRKRFGKKRLLELLEEIKSQSIKNQKDVLLSQFENFKNGEVQRDDIALIGVKF